MVGLGIHCRDRTDPAHRHNLDRRGFCTRRTVASTRHNAADGPLENALWDKKRLDSLAISVLMVSRGGVDGEELCLVPESVGSNARTVSAMLISTVDQCCWKLERGVEAGAPPRPKGLVETSRSFPLLQSCWLFHAHVLRDSPVG